MALRASLTIRPGVPVSAEKSVSATYAASPRSSMSCRYSALNRPLQHSSVPSRTSLVS